MKVFDCLEVWKEVGDCNFDPSSVTLMKGAEVFKAQSQNAFTVQMSTPY